MPITVEIADTTGDAAEAMAAAFSYLEAVDHRFSTYRADSEISAINAGSLRKDQYSADMREVLRLSAETQQATDGYFDIRRRDGTLDPSGLVKGWSLRKAAALLDSRGFRNFYVDGGGDIEVRGKNAGGADWSVGIAHPFQADVFAKVLRASDLGIATSGTYRRGTHVYDPVHGHMPIRDIVSMTVVGPNVYEADRFATAALAMGEDGIRFIEALAGFEGYMIDAGGMATMTGGFERYVVQ